MDKTQQHISAYFGEEVARRIDTPQHVPRGHAYQGDGTIPFRSPFAADSLISSAQESAPPHKTRVREKLDHDHERTALHTFLGEVQARNKEAEQMLSEGREALVKKKPMPMSIANRRKAALSNLSQEVRLMSLQELSERHEIQIDRLNESHTLALSHLREEGEHVKRQMDEANTRESEARAEVESLQHVNKLLREKMTKLQSREVANERKLEVFGRLEPIFQKLADHFDFRSADDVIRRFETLENTQLTSFTDFMEMQESKTELERKVVSLEKSSRDELERRVRALQQAVDREERRNQELQHQLSSAYRSAERALEFRDKYLELNSAVMQLCSTWSEHALAQPDNPSARPDLSTPLKAVAALHTLFTVHNPTQASKSLSDLAGLANTFWWKYFDHNESLRSRPRQTFEALAALLDKWLYVNHRLVNHIKTQEDQMQKMHESILHLERGSRAMETEFHRRAMLSVRPSSLPKGVSAWQSSEPKQKDDTPQQQAQQESVAQPVKDEDDKAGQLVDLFQWEEELEKDFVRATRGRRPATSIASVSATTAAKADTPESRHKFELNRMNFSELEREVEAEVSQAHRAEKERWRRKRDGVRPTSSMAARPTSSMAARPTSSMATAKPSTPQDGQLAARYRPDSAPPPRFYEKIVRPPPPDLTIRGIASDSVTPVDRNPSSVWRLEQSRRSPVVSAPPPSEDGLV